MTKARLTDPSAAGGGTPPGDPAATCCLARGGYHEVQGRKFDRIYQQFGRSKAWFTAEPSNAANLPDGVTWEPFYYISTYAYLLHYRTNGASGGGKFDGTLTVTLRCNAVVHNTPRALRASAPALFTDVTPAVIERAFTGWNEAVQSHWTNKRYTVEIGAPDCPGKFVMRFVLVKGGLNSHVTFSVLDMKSVDHATWTAASDPRAPNHATAKALLNEHRSNAIKFNLGDPRGNLVFAHEFGHWMGWGDEYIEVTGRDLADPANPTGPKRWYETRGAAQQSLRVAIRIKNPTRSFQSARGTDIEEVDLTATGSKSWLMGSMADPLSYQPRFVYTIVHDFLEFYNADHYGGGTTAYCVNVTLG
jgi:hypothetical protein